MKKILLGLSILVIVFLLFSLLNKKELARHQVVPSDRTEKPVIANETDSVSPTANQPSTTQEPVEKNINVNIDDKVPSNVCKEQLAELYPELDRHYHQIIEGFYLSEEQMMGDGVYQNMSFDSLKPLADSNEPDAMMVYGSDKIWHSATGIRISKSDSQYRTQEQTQEIVKNHEIDLVGISEGEDYLFRAAVFGKVGSIFEASMLLELTARQMDRKDYTDNLIEDVLVKSLAYKKLLIDIFKNDSAIGGVFLSSDDPFKNIQRLYADRENFDEIKARIEAGGEILYQEFKKRWEHDREYYGFEIYPDYLQGDLEEYGNAYLECHLR